MKFAILESVKLRVYYITSSQRCGCLFWKLGVVWMKCVECSFANYVKEIMEFELNFTVKSFQVLSVVLLNYMILKCCSLSPVDHLVFFFFFCAHFINSHSQDCHLTSCILKCIRKWQVTLLLWHLLLLFVSFNRYDWRSRTRMSH